MIPFLACRCLNLSACSFFQNIYRRKKKKNTNKKEFRCINSYSILWLKGFHSASYISTFYPCNVFLKMAWKGKKTDTVSLKLSNLQCIKMFNSNSSHSRIYEKSSSKMCVSEKKVCPEGFLGSVSFGEKKCVQICKANKWGVQKPGCAHERMWNWTSFYTLIHAFTRNQAVKCVLVRKRFALRGFLGACPSVKKNVYKFAKQTNEAFKNLAALTKGCEIELPFMLSTDFFSIFSIVC